jgi:cystathionine beta-synthase
MKKKYCNNILETIGNTPLVKINELNPNKNVVLLAKLENFNPGLSIKDRIALHIIEEAEKSGKLKPGGTIIESTSGNTGLGLALVALVKGYKTIFTIPDKMSQEKIDILKSFGAEVVITPTAVASDDPRNYWEVAKRLNREIPNSYYVNQHWNPYNPEAHYLTTGPEIWEQTGGKIDYLVAGMGTCGTISGTGKYLKEKNPNIKVIGVDPEGSIFYDYFKTGKITEAHTYKVEGIGEDIIVGTSDFKVIDDIIQVNDKQAFNMARRLLKKEGIFVGGSSGAAMYGALQLIKKIKSKKIVVVIFPDSGIKYLSKIFNDKWMKENKFI